ncbi:MAG: hypothetical protein JWP27_1321 [Flaviaesturariibacter sp.]|nr:hypothetical protein [Flaviaesturariibacter sp.]
MAVHRNSEKSNKPDKVERSRLARTRSILAYARAHGYSTHYSFLIDMQLPANRNRFFVCDLSTGAVIDKGLVAHGSCHADFAERPQFSNVDGSGCSSEGRYKIGTSYQGRYGKAYRLHGLDATNSHALARAVVLHSYPCVPDTETDGFVCNSLGCPMVSPLFLTRLAAFIDSAKKPVLLWIYTGGPG